MEYSKIKWRVSYHRGYVVDERKKKMMLELVSTYEDVVKNAKIFCEQLKDEEDLRRKLSFFRHWYYFEEIDQFAPSKFIGYQNITVVEYNLGNNLDGRETEKQLRKWFKKIPVEEYEQYNEKLEDYLFYFDKKPNKSICLHIKK